MKNIFVLDLLHVDKGTSGPYPMPEKISSFEDALKSVKFGCEGLLPSIEKRRMINIVSVREVTPEGKVVNEKNIGIMRGNN